MKDTELTVAQLRSHIREFCHVRGWNRGRNAQNLAMALSVETAELLEIFQWLEGDAAQQLEGDPASMTHLKEEIADVFWYLMRICDCFGIDLAEAVEDKTVKNARKYPAPEISAASPDN